MASVILCFYVSVFDVPGLHLGLACFACQFELPRQRSISATGNERQRRKVRQHQTQKTFEGPRWFDLPQVNHTFLPGHRIMVMVQSTLFPLYDRNPQTFVPNIFNARPEDHKSAEQKIWHTRGEVSFIELPVVK